MKRVMTALGVNEEEKKVKESVERRWRKRRRLSMTSMWRIGDKPNPSLARQQTPTSQDDKE